MKDKIDNIQVLRGFAALAVVVFHTTFTLGSWRPAGAFGVDIFFVISGFIMAMICAANTEHFFLKRLIRIVPLYWMMTLILFAIAITAMTYNPLIPPGTKGETWEFFKSLSFIPYRRVNGFLFPIVLVGWTLNYEMFFYVLLSLGIFMAKKRAVKIALLLLVGSMFSFRQMPHSAVSEFYSNSIMLEFAGGVLVYEIYKRSPAKLCVRMRPFFAGAIFVSIAFMAWYDGTRPNGEELLRRALFLGLPSLLLLQSVVLLSKSGMDAKWRFPVLLGDASYSLYLTHFYVIWVMRGVAIRYAPWFYPNAFWGMIAAVGVSCLVGIGVHRFVDRPIYTAFNRMLVSRQQKRVPVLQTVP